MPPTSPPRSWRETETRDRCRKVSAARHQIARQAERLIAACANAQRTDPVETLTGELFPLCAALKFIGRQGPKVLQSRMLGAWGRPLWLWGVRSEVRREPLGDVLILAAWNYPLLLPGVQLAQGLAAGNRVWLKPAPGCETASELLVESFHAAGVPRDAIGLLGSSPQAAQDRIDQGVDLVVLTGGSTTGQAVMTRCAPRLTPAVMELSGCDAVIVGPGADLGLVAKAVAFGLRFNAGATCIGPRRIIVGSDTRGELIERLRERLADAPAVAVHPSARDTATRLIREAFAQGGTDLLRCEGEAIPAPEDGRMRPVIIGDVDADWPIASADLFAPVASLIVADDDARRAEIVNGCRFRLAASIFGDTAWATPLAGRLDVGHVSINDLIFPTSDPRVPFGGCGQSGFGVTRGEEGLLAMTRPKVIAHHRGKWRLHLGDRKESDLKTLLGFLRWTHGG